MKHFTKFYYFASLLICFLFAGQLSYADGSKDLYATGVGGRAKLRSSTVTSDSYPFANLNRHYVYAKAGERITMASSVMGTGSATIKLMKPDGTSQIFNTAVGKIDNRAAELGGPRLFGQAAGGNRYIPNYYTVPVGGTGIYSVDFVPPAGETGTGTSGRETSSKTAGVDWLAPASTHTVIAAWDVSVINDDNTGFINGRVYANVLNLDINSVFASAYCFYGKMYVLTRDGYVYNVDNNGNNGISFEFFVNNKGFFDAAGEPIYKSLNNSTAASLVGKVKDPNTTDTPADVTHKMFYTKPSVDLPISSTGAVPGGTTWLKNPRLKPKVTDLKIFGVDGTEGQVSNKGGNIKFTSNLYGRFTIKITSTKSVGDLGYFATRTISGAAKIDENIVPWDGKDGNNVPLPAGMSPAKLTIQLQGAEVHFPYFDVEINPNGIKLELLEDDMVTVASDIVYWNDTDITLYPANDKPSSPINASQFVLPAGTSSNVNGHIWGTNASPTSGTFGDIKSIDTWTFILGDEETLNTNIDTRKADLKVESVTPDKAKIGVNDPIVYTVVVKNDGPSDVVGAPFAFNVPTGYKITGATYVKTCPSSTETVPLISADFRHYTSKLDLENQCTITYSITVVPVSATPGSIIVDATILRPNDVTDPDATNPDPNIPPTDPYYECANNGLGTPCNNIKSNTSALFVSKLTAIKSIVGNPATVKPGDVLTYNITLTNTDAVAKTGVTASDDVPGTLTAINTISNAGTLTGNKIDWAGLTVPANGNLVLSFKATVVTNLPVGTTSIKNVASIIDPIDPTVPVTPEVEKPTEGKITAVKTIVGNPATVKPGDVLTYNITLTNNFGTVKTGVTASDNVPSTLTSINTISNAGTLAGNKIDWAGLTVPANGTLVLSFKATVVANLPVGTTSIKNVASIIDPIDPTVPVTPEVEKPTEGKITAVKTIVGNPATVKPGDVLTYNITLTNNFGTAKTGVTASDNVPSTLTSINTISNAGTLTGNKIDWAGLTVPANGTLVLSFKATVVTNLPVGTTSIKNVASIIDPIDPTVPVTPEVEKPTEGKITAVKTIVGNPATVKPGDVLTYNITLTNNFGTAKTGVTASDNVPSTLTSINTISNAGTLTGNKIDWAGLTVPANGTLVLSFKATVVTNLPVGTTSIKNVASIIDPIDPTVPVTPEVEKPTEGKITAVKTIVGNPATVKPGDVLTYNITLTNNFGTAKTGVTASDNVPSTLTSINTISNAGTLTGNKIDWAGLTVPANGTLVLSFKATVVTNLPVGTTSIKNVASIIDPIDPTVPVTPEVEKPTEGKITAVKTIVGNPATVKPGDVLTYNITLTNNFGTAKTGVTASDNVPSTLTSINTISNAGTLTGNKIDWAGLTVPANGTLVLSFKATVVTNLPVGTTSIKNVASIIDPIDPTVPVTPEVEKPTEGKITAVKTIVGNPATVKPGDVLTYNITLTNNFGTAKTGVTASDNVPSTLTSINTISNAGTLTGNKIDWAGLTVPANGTLVLSFKATVVTNLPVGTTSIKNVASIIDPIDPTVPVTPEVEKPTEGKITAVKTIVGNPATVKPGDVLTYNITLTNNFGTAKTGVTASDNVPSTLTSINTISNAGTLTGNKIDWAGLTVPANGILVLSFKATVVANLPVGTTSIKNVASIIDPIDPTVPVTPEVEKPTEGKITAVKTIVGNPATVKPGDVLTYNITLTNNFGTAKTGVTASDNVPSTLTSINTISNAGTLTGNKIDWAGLTVPANGTLVLSFKATVVTNLPVGTTSIKNVASIIDPIDPTVPVTPEVEKPTEGKITAVKTIVGNPATVKPGDVLTYNITLTNNFGTAKTGVTASDNVPSTLTSINTISNAGTLTGNKIDWAGLTVPANGTLVLSFKATVVTNLPVGTTSIKNVASIIDPIDPTVPVTPEVEKPTEGKITAVKTIVGNPATVKPGDVLTYNITLTNNFATAKTGVTASDNVPSTLTSINTISNAGTLAGNKIDWAGLTVPANGTLVLSFKATVVANLPVGTTSIKNVASIIDPIDPTVPVTPEVEKPTEGKITAVKTIVGNPATVKPGDVLTYNITLTNSFGTAKTGVTASDNVPSTLTSINTISNAGTLVGNKIDWAGLTVPANGTLVLSFKATVSGDLPVGTTSIKNVASIIDPIDPTVPIIPEIEVPVNESPAINLVKTVTNTGTAVGGAFNVGDKIEYTFTIKNTGDVTLNNINITDPLISNSVINIPGSILPNNEIKHVANYIVTQADADAGNVTNSALVKASSPGGKIVEDKSGTTVAGDDPTITPIIQNPSLSLTKTAVVGVHNKVGDIINYNLVVKNTGNVTVTAIAITDANADAGSISPALIASLAPNASVNIVAKHTVTQADLDRGYVTNIAKADGKDPKGGNVHAESTDPTPIPGAPVDPTCTTCTITPIDQAPSLSLTKTAVVGVHNKVGDIINYNLVVKNTGNVTVTAIAITDANADAGSISPALIASLAPNASVNIVAKHTVTQADLDRGYVTNIAKADGKDPKGGNVHAESTDPTPVPGAPVDPTCTTCTITPIDQAPSLSLTKTAVVGVHNKVGDIINYNLVVKNTGNVTVTAIAITDANADAGSISPALIASLAPNASVNIVAKHTVTQADLDRGYVTNIAKADGKDPKGGNVHAESTDPTPVPGAPVDPTCTTCTITPIDQAPSLSLTKTAVVGVHNKVGDIINYNLVVKNTGNVTVTAIAITDANADAGSISPALIASLAPNASVNITAKHTVTQADLDRGYVTNIAKADGKDPKGGNVHAESTDPTPVPGAPVDPTCTTCTITPVEQKGAVALVKKVTNAGTGENGAFVLGNQIEYTFTVTNTGNVSLKDLVLNDPLLNKPNITIPGVLLPGKSVSHVEKYTITAADVVAGKVTNQAVIKATDPKGGNVTDQSGTDTNNDNPTVITIAKPPVAKEDTKETQQNKPVVIDVQRNDEPGSSAIVPGSTTIITQPKNGTVKVNADGTVTYTPNPGYTGTDEFTYTVTDKNGQISNPAKVTLTVVPTKPVAIDDTAETQWNTEVKIPVLGNDKTDGAAFDKSTVEITEQPKNGTVKVNPDGTVTYLPNSGYTGTDTFKYRVKDEYGNWTDIAIVTVNVKGFFIPNVITPNGDGKNDSFVIVGLENYGNADVTIFNRWGNEVYRNNNYKNTWTGEGLNEGTYYYLIRLNNSGKQEVYKGWVLIKR